MRSDRLLSILLLLQTRGQVRASELAERLEVSMRTIYRDVEALSASGVPVYAERGRHGGIALLPGYRTDVTGLTRDEARSLFVLATRGALADLGLDGALGSALRKVMAALPEPHRPAAALASQRILVDRTGWMRRDPAPVASLDQLQAAVFSDRRLRLRYRHSGETQVRRYTVDPYGLVDKAGTWYLVADHRGSPRLFRASRVISASLDAAVARRRPGVELRALWKELRRQVERPADVEVVTRVRPRVLDRFLRINASHLAEQPGADPPPGRPASGPEAAPGSASAPAGPGPTADHTGRGGTEGWVEVRLRLRAVAAARPLIGFGADVEVMSPEEVRADLAQVASAAARIYAPSAPDTRAGQPDGGREPGDGDRRGGETGPESVTGGEAADLPR